MLRTSKFLKSLLINSEGLVCAFSLTSPIVKLQSFDSSSILGNSKVVAFKSSGQTI